MAMIEKLSVIKNICYILHLMSFFDKKGNRGLGMGKSIFNFFVVLNRILKGKSKKIER